MPQALPKHLPPDDEDERGQVARSEIVGDDADSAGKFFEFPNRPRFDDVEEAEKKKSGHGEDRQLYPRQEWKKRYGDEISQPLTGDLVDHDRTRVAFLSAAGPLRADI